MHLACEKHIACYIEPVAAFEAVQEKLTKDGLNPVRA